MSTSLGEEEAAIVTIPLESVGFRAGAIANRDMVSVLDEAATKKNTKESGSRSRGGVGLDLETALNVQVRVRPLGEPAWCWMDVHVFDGDDQLIRSETLPLQHVQTEDDGDIYGFDAKVYRGSGASPGSVWLAPDARRVQYRVYYEAGGTVYSDGLLRQHELAPDSSVTNSAPPPAASGGRRRASTAPAPAAPAVPAPSR